MGLEVVEVMVDIKMEEEVQAVYQVGTGLESTVQELL